MKERSILMSAPMVLAILAGRKTVTRRLDQRWALAQQGEALWVKETWRTAKDCDGLSPAAIGEKAVDAGYPKPWGPIEYVADGHRNGNWSAWPSLEAGRTRVSIHMPRWASRIVLPIVSVRVEKLHDITEEDARAEGIQPDSGLPPNHFKGPRFYCATARRAFQDLWGSIHGDGSWSSNPTVVRVEFAPLAREARP